MIEYYLIRNKKTGKYLLNSITLGVEVSENIFENNFLRQAMFTYFEILHYIEKVNDSLINFPWGDYEKVLLTISIEEKAHVL